MVEKVSDEHQSNLFDKINNLILHKTEKFHGSDIKISQNSDSKELTNSSSKSDVDEKDLLSRKIYESIAIENFVNSTSDIDPFFVVDLNSISNQFEKWRYKLPRFTPFYAVKCNNNPGVLKTLVSLGASFDCASMEEIKTMLDYGVSPRQIIYANPCKSPNYIKFAAQNGINRMTFDNSDELFKIKDNHPKAELVIRIHVDDSKSICQLGVKFGVRLGSTKQLLELAMKLGLNVIGVSFHVGSGCTDSSAYADAIKRAKDVFDEAKEIGFEFNLLDIGGGFPGLAGNYVKIEFEEIANVINNAYDKYFNGAKHIELIAEPGRFFTSSSFTLVTNITSRRPIESGDGKSYMYYLNDGVYGSFNCLIFDHAHLPYPKFVTRNSSGQFTFTTSEELKTAVYESSIWGPTCDSMDCLSQSIKMPELNVEDWMVFENMGAYTLVASSRFNGMNNPKVYYLNSDNEKNMKPAYLSNTMPKKRACLEGDEFVLS
jgi:ornithine decarboxylase